MDGLAVENNPLDHISTKSKAIINLDLDRCEGHLAF